MFLCYSEDLCDLLFSQTTTKHHLRYQDLRILSKRSQEKTMPSRELGGAWRTPFVLTRSAGCSGGIEGLSAPRPESELPSGLGCDWPLTFVCVFEVSKTGRPKWVRLTSCLVLSRLPPLVLLKRRGKMIRTPAEHPHIPGKKDYTKSLRCGYLSQDVLLCSFCLQNR